MSSVQSARTSPWATATPQFSAIRVLAITAVSIVLSEIIAMGTLRLMDLSSYVTETLVDVSIMIALCFPVLYALTFRPLANLAEACVRARRELMASNAELEATNRAERSARERLPGRRYDQHRQEPARLQRPHEVQRVAVRGGAAARDRPRSDGGPAARSRPAGPAPSQPDIPALALPATPAAAGWAAPAAAALAAARSAHPERGRRPAPRG